MYLLSGFVEPFLYLLSIGVGLGHLVGGVQVTGRTVTYAEYVAPGLLAAQAMNGAIFDTTYNLYYKLKYAHTYEAVLATPLGTTEVALGEMGWALARGTTYAAAFLGVMAGLGLVLSPWAVLCLPVASLVSLTFAATGMAATSYMRSWQDLDTIALALLPLFLFSGTFYPLSVYPAAVAWIVRCTPLYQGVDVLRAFDTGTPSWGVLWHVAYLAALAAFGVAVTARRLRRLLAP
jgi:lipooligosaccharide transport system permease protein